MRPLLAILGLAIALLSGAAAATALRYDFDYPEMNYAGTPVHNPIAELQARIDRGEVKLRFNAQRGYLDSLLAALAIDKSSQTLVYSKTSLQIDAIRAATPRAIYFNDDTYVAWVQGTTSLELVAMDSALGPVFYTLDNHEGAAAQLQRETSRCLNCHDTFSMMGGGVPRFLFMSTLVNRGGEALTNQPGTDTSDETPLEERWGGWYVSGNSGNLRHLGNILVDSAKELDSAQSASRPENLNVLDSVLDTRPYITNKSDVVALLVFEHQAYVHNLITRANFKSRTVLAREGITQSVDALHWKDLSPKAKVAMKAMLEPLVRAMLFSGAAGMTNRISGSSGFESWFQAQGPRDRAGRSLRELDLSTRLFKYPLSFLVYSQGFKGLPSFAKDYLYGRFAEILSGRDASPAYSHLTASDRKNLAEILTATSPEFALAARQPQTLTVSVPRAASAS
ncbi:MAG: hypothetical protein ABI885_01445 [Gammaproteobacteria bacterium]